MTDLLQAKNGAILDLEAARKAGASRRVVEDLASYAATLEIQIAEGHLERERGRDAGVSFLSAASCMLDANRRTEAFRLLDRAEVYAETARMRELLDSEKARVGSRERPASIFTSSKARIANNPLLRVPQREAYLAAHLHFMQSSEHAIIQLPVGCGKTGTMAILPFGLARGRALVITPNLEITNVVAENLDYTSAKSFYRKARVLENGSGPAAAILNAEANLLDCDNAAFVIANIQQLVANDASKWLGRLPQDYFDLILVDEGHHNIASSWQRVFEHFPSAKVTSFTATPLRSDGQAVEGRRIYRFPIAEAIRDGYVRDLASRRLEPTEIHFEYQGSHSRHSLQEVLELREEAWFSRGVALSRECNVHIVDASIQCMRELRDNSSVKHQIIAAACSIDHAKAIRSLYAERGLAAEVIHSDLEDNQLGKVRRRLEGGELDVIVQVSMLGEGADYPQLGVAAIFRPYRHLVPYTQFVGRVMRVVKQNAPGDPDNRGFVVSHVGLNVDRWWTDLKRLDKDDQLFFEQLANSELSFQAEPQTSSDVSRRRYRPPMEVLDEVVERFVEVGFLEETRTALVDDVIQALGARGVDLDTLGIDRRELEERISAATPRERIGKLFELPVQPQRRRREARRRLNERVRSAAGEVLRRLGITPPGFQVPRAFPGTGASNNIGAAIILLNKEVQRYVNIGTDERDLLSTEELESAYRSMDEIVEQVTMTVQMRVGRGPNA